MKKRYCILLFFLIIKTVNILYGQDNTINSEYIFLTVQKVSELISEYYVFPDEGKVIGEKLVSTFRSFPDFTQNQDSLALVLTQNLHKISNDHHFAIVYDPVRVRELRNEDNIETDDEELRQYQKERLEKRKKNNFGFKRVEVLDGNIGYLKLDFFREDSMAIEIAHSAMNFLSNSDAIIIDLRNNHGGGASMFTLLTSYFLAMILFF